MAKLMGEVTLPQRAALLWGWRAPAVSMVGGTQNQCPGTPVTLVTPAHSGPNTARWQCSLRTWRESEPRERGSVCHGRDGLWGWSGRSRGNGQQQGQHSQPGEHKQGDRHVLRAEQSPAWISPLKCGLGSNLQRNSFSREQSMSERKGLLFLCTSACFKRQHKLVFKSVM